MKTASLQRKISVTKPAKADPFAMPDGDVQPSCICIYDRRARKPVQIVPLTEKEVLDTLTLCLKPGTHEKSSGDVIARAIRNKLRGPQIGNVLAEIDEAANEAAFFLQRIVGGDLNPMVERMSDRLQDAVNNAFCALRGEPAAQ